MVKIECELQGDFYTILGEIEEAVLGGFSASLEDESDFYHPHCRCAVRVDARIQLSAISSGSSQAIFFKVNTVGEEPFLEVIRSTVEKYQL